MSLKSPDPIHTENTVAIGLIYKPLELCDEIGTFGVLVSAIIKPTAVYTKAEHFLKESQSTIATILNIVVDV